MKAKLKSTNLILTYLTQYKIATIEELKITLDTQSRMTTFRKLNELDYISSCSHSGRYYSLKKIARFNKYGLWRYNSVLFSKYGTLKNTLENIIHKSLKGYSASELNKIINCKVDDVLLELFKSKNVIRKKISGIYIYFSNEINSLKKQELIRNDIIKNDVYIIEKQQVITDELKAALIIFFSTLNEKQRRLYAGLESLKEGHGGDRLIAELLGLDQRTVAKGRKELMSGNVDVDINRKKGGGRQQVKKKSQTSFKE